LEPKITRNSITFTQQVGTPRNEAHAPLLAESFPTVPRMQPGDPRSGRSQCNKQTKQTNSLSEGIDLQAVLLYPSLFYHSSKEDKTACKCK